MRLKIFVPIAFLAFTVMVPVNYTNGTLEHSNLTYSNIDKLSISNIPTGSYRQNWLDYYQLKYARNQSKRTFVKGKSTDAIDFYTSEIERLSKETYCPGSKAPDLEEDDKFYEDFNMDEVDLNIENYEEIFGVDGIGSLFGVKDMSGADLNHRCTYMQIEGSSIGLVKSMQPAISNPTSADSVMSSKTDPNLCFATQAHSSISFSGLSVECSAADHQDWCFSNGSHGRAASIVS
ncbi:Zinc finger protein CONSTANS-LIKE 9 [Camellia lanceoleosa]|uniref:Zinc finger protein CONSTANS-LIKE 9 n=1 Tax=Camellia lanceoleosa TaxID=1840588 RepID=A0ACC0FKH5_9ERIC|nr:Zinc finger protein CONSTANS-LIKE 9 [Camellia lanceoleosa]